MSDVDQIIATQLPLPPGPEGLLEFSGGLNAGQSPLTILRDLVEGHGDIVHFRTRFDSFCLVNHPSLVRDVFGNHNFVRSPIMRTVLGNGLLAANGPHWERQRRLMLPAFQSKRIEAMVGLFARVAEQRIGTWSERTDSSGCLNVSREMDRIALSNVAQALFGREIEDEFLNAFNVVMREISSIGNAAVFGAPLVREQTSARRYQDAMQIVEATVQSILDADESKDSLTFNLLQILRSAQRSNGEAALSRRELRDEVVTMITAGHETTAVSLAWACYAIASHPEVSQRFYDEIDDVVGGRPIVATDLPRLKYTRQIYDETLRLYPPIWLVSRLALRDDELGGFRIPAGSGVLVSPFVLQRHPEFWPDAERFDPERFADGDKFQGSHSYCPFLAGRHLCLGKSFAITEAMIVLAVIGQRFRLHLRSDRPVEYEPLLSLRIRDGLQLELEPRDRGRRR